MDVAPPAALKAAARPPVDCSERETSCANGPTGCWSGSVARTGRSRFAAPASTSTAWKPRFAGTVVRDVGALARTIGADGGVTLVAYVSTLAAPAGLLAN